MNMKLQIDILRAKAAKTEERAALTAERARKAMTAAMRAQVQADVAKAKLRSVLKLFGMNGDMEATNS